MKIYVTQFDSSMSPMGEVVAVSSTLEEAKVRTRNIEYARNDDPETLKWVSDGKHGPVVCGRIQRRLHRNRMGSGVEMSYETAPATVMLATACAVCGRPLVDAASVQAGMGPDCRAKYAKAVVPEEARTEANACVYRLALYRGQELGCPTPAEAVELLKRIRALHLYRLAGVLEERLCDVSVEEVEYGERPAVALSTPFAEGFARDLKRSTPVYRWDETRGAWLLPPDKAARDAAWAVVRRHFGGRLGRGPKGVFFVSEASTARG